MCEGKESHDLRRWTWSKNKELLTESETERKERGYGPVGEQGPVYSLLEGPLGLRGSTYREYRDEVHRRGGDPMSLPFTEVKWGFTGNLNQIVYSSCKSQVGSVEVKWGFVKWGL